MIIEYLDIFSLKAYSISSLLKNLFLILCEHCIIFKVKELLHTKLSVKILKCLKMCFRAFYLKRQHSSECLHVCCVCVPGVCPSACLPAHLPASVCVCVVCGVCACLCACLCVHAFVLANGYFASKRIKFVHMLARQIPL